MLNVILEILSILGILLLCLLGLAVLLLFLVLFFPVSYKLSGKRNAEEMTLSAGASWLFGFLRVRFDHPEPGRILVKILPFTVFDSGKKADGKSRKPSGGSEDKKQKTGKQQETGTERQQTADTEQDAATGAAAAESDPKPAKDRAQNESQTDITKASAGPEAGAGGEGAESTETDRTLSEKAETANGSSDGPKAEEAGDDTDPFILKKFKKIKYTICSIYDKIKNIWENISYYIELLQEEETKLLFSHVICRLGKILKSIRPRRIRGQILFGTGSPDTTGYAYGIYGMLSPFLGGGLAVAPDFTEAVLEGNIFISGHITLFTILWNGLKILLDKNLRRFIKKIKAGRKR